MLDFVEKCWIIVVSVAQTCHIKQRGDVLVFSLGTKWVRRWINLDGQYG